MKLYLVQHGNAEPKEIDPNRPLSQEGKTDVKKVAQFVKSAGIQVSAIWHSGKTRALQTAEILAKTIGADRGLVERKGLSPKNDCAWLIEEVKAAKEDLMITGHLPFLSHVSDAILGSHKNRNCVRFQQGGIVCIKRDSEGNWQLCWMVIPGILA